MLNTISLSLPNRAVLVKLFCYNDNSTLVALRKFGTLKRMRKFTLTIKNPRIMVAKSEKTYSFNVCSKWGRKPVPVEGAEKVVIQVEKD